MYLYQKARHYKNKISFKLRLLSLSYPKRVECNVCNWSGRRFLSDSWHENIRCPICRSCIRQRLLLATLQYLNDYSLDKLIDKREILHFAPEKRIGSILKSRASNYRTADYLREDCDYKVDMSNMPEIDDECFDIVLAFDVLEHVPDYQNALKEVRRVLSDNGYGVFTVPQKDNLSVTYEGPAIVTPEERTRHFGQWDHLRIFGDDFSNIVEDIGFNVVAVDESFFDSKIANKHVLYPPQLSSHPLATNYRKIFIAQKV